jgi:hypothetical protein
MAAAQLAWAASLRSKFRTPHATGAEYGSRRQAGLKERTVLQCAFFMPAKMA